MAFAVCIPRDRSEAVKVHSESCRYFRDRDLDAVTVEWEPGFPSTATAVARAQELAKPGQAVRPARCCLRGKAAVSPTPGPWFPGLRRLM